MLDPKDPYLIFEPTYPASLREKYLGIYIEEPNLDSLKSIPSFTLPTGSTLSDAQNKLPSSVVGSFSNGKTADIPVKKWDTGTPEFNGAAGTYTFEGSLGCLVQQLSFARQPLYGAGSSIKRERGGCGYLNPNNLTAKAVVTVTDTTVTPNPNPNPDPGTTTPVTPTPTPTTPAPATRSVQVIVTNPNSGQTAAAPITRDIGTDLPLRGVLYSANGQPVAGVPELTLLPNGTINIPASLPSGTYRLALNVVAPSGERLAGPPATLTVDAAGNATLNAELIDPYGVITDSATGRPIPGVKATLYWADTANNRAKGRTPNTPVVLPALPDFAPNQNADPQNSNAQGQYGWMVFPEGDYYILAEKEGYQPFDSRKSTTSATFDPDSYIRDGNIHVGQTIAEYSFAMDPNTRPYTAYMRGYPDGTFQPQRSVSRAELAAILNRTMQKKDVVDSAVVFNDVSLGKWARADILAAVEQGWMRGTSSTRFEPDRAVTRAEMAQILMNVYQWTPAASTASSFSDVNGHWASRAIAAAASQGVLSGYSNGTFRPDQPLTRAETVVLINRLTQRPSAPELPVTWSDVPSSASAYGDIMAASLDHSSPVD
ncbi:S-layer homology domain-containing protein [Saccharibacillus sp. CPCC 101409]|uniref:S-layer homology domain-containing protein n=1 Tax=Saccharibacillus sp. CPCC 101409 TaxID=3058041 RepID=UPI0026710CB6|nr:S-layer homology domain-containing protein [Saccharibacillus sp. CPCC 101409]MDO3408304.1 S-layer homology domain-containing protein [Saccharibacillus sp. CPCC 101409]